MNFFDLLFLLFLCIFLLYGLKRGGTPEFFSTAGTVSGYILGMIYAEPYHHYLTPYVQTTQSAITALFLLIIITCWLVASILSHLLQIFIRQKDIGPVSRFFGGMLGSFKAICIFLIVTNVVGHHFDSFFDDLELSYFHDITAKLAHIVSGINPA